MKGRYSWWDDPLHREWQARFGARLYELRTARELTQEELSEMAGITRRAVIFYERSEQIPRLDVAIKLARALGVTLDGLVDWR